MCRNTSSRGARALLARNNSSCALNREDQIQTCALAHRCPAPSTLRKRHILARSPLFLAFAVSSHETFPAPADPKPLPPERPGDNECCQSGCDPCVFDFYNDEMERYRQELTAWEARQAGRVRIDTAS